VNRRDFLAASALASVAAPELLARAYAQPAPFDRAIVRQMARDLAAKPYKAPDDSLPDHLRDIDYDHYRAIRFLPERALWRDEKLPFEAQFFHRGFFYKNRVDIFEVKNGQASTNLNCFRSAT
jgi:periplasmic glucans biosynthesis protein